MSFHPARPRNTTHSNLAQHHETDGDTLYLHCGVLQYFMRPLVITRDPRNVEHMLKTNFDNFPKGEAFHDSVHELLGDGIFNADGDLWYKQRKTASQMFTASRFKNHIWRLGRLGAILGQFSFCSLQTIKQPMPFENEAFI